ncbi:hypothetical protein LOTGIDRAFT_156000 [Lottia gigantea]|uniref:Fucolectin tachylectin-4 pentraxin-1 domain-containing protein n=1 Tax=Lottia gigantea TaxID=225164 RepID=V4BB50_LOTGI|nr:hypothetical protein LOTGIDRAFT_156000 [Lottia gigantea]ESP04776.1 hypothetical protein LOTGIDRAFT_156000 [Lottia gigantea]
MASLILGSVFLGLIIHIQSYNFGYNNSYTSHCLNDERSYKFGYNNSFTCHCLNNETCDTVTGRCGSGCSRGWRGPSCQRENIASDSMFVSQSGVFNNRQDLYGPKLVVDGYNDTNRNIHYCSDTDTDNSTWQWWFIDLQEEYPIGYLKIFHKYDRLYVFKGFSVHIDDKLCFQHTDTSDPPAVFPIECYGTLTGRYLNISRYSETKNYIALCEVEIYVCSQG